MPDTLSYTCQDCGRSYRQDKLIRDKKGRLKCPHCGDYQVTQDF